MQSLKDNSIMLNEIIVSDRQIDSNYRNLRSKKKPFQVMTKTLPYSENHALRDGRLAICGLAVFIAGFALVWDFFFPFPQVL